MVNKFKDIWIKKTHLESDIEDEVDGARHYREMANEAPNKMEEQVLQGMAQDEERHAQQLRDMETKSETTKGITQEISKPGPSIHSAKWDRCVEEVGKDPDVNAYAVCTAQLGEESFKSNMTKSELEMAKAELKKAIDITEAGKIPTSLLARQDLKGDKETTSKSEDKSYTISIEYRHKEDSEWSTKDYEVEARSDDEAKKMAISMWEKEFNPPSNSPTISEQCYVIRSEGVNIKKGAIEQTGKKLEDAAEKAEEVEGTTEKEDLVRNIKNIQLKRQNAILEARKGGSFKDVWGKLKL